MGKTGKMGDRIVGNEINHNPQSEAVLTVTHGWDPVSTKKQTTGTHFFIHVTDLVSSFEKHS